MQLGMMGLGRMGGNRAIRLAKAGHGRAVYDSHQEAVDALVREGMKGATDLPGFVRMLGKCPDLDDLAGRVSDSGEGRWTLQAPVDERAPAPVISAALSARFGSRGEADYADRLLSALRFGFGGDFETPKSDH